MRLSWQMAVVLVLMLWLRPAYGARIVYGETPLRMPLLMPAEEIFYQGAAWADGIRALASELPPLIERRLWERDLDNPVARQTLAALSVLPASVLLKNGDRAELILPLDDEWENNATERLDAVDNFFFSTIAWLEANRLLSEMEETWPGSLSDVWSKAQTLEEQAETIQELRDLFPSLSDPTRSIFVSHATRSIIGIFLTGRNALETGRPRAAFEAAERLLERLDFPESPDTEAPLAFMKALGFLLRGQAQLLLGQQALASLDLEQADALLASLPVRSGWRGESLETLGNLAALKENESEMCEYYRQACAFGRCDGLNSATCP